ncbi:MAG: gluconokinase [Acidobacteriota bacterium]
MGVSGCGKSTVANLLAETLGWPWLEGDDLHPAANVVKMQSGRPLDDTDRAPWLEAIRRHLDDALAAAGPAGLVVTCSALKRAYRRRLGPERPGIRAVHLHGSHDLLAARLAARRGHFMPASLLTSQLEALKPPRNALVLEISASPRQLVEEILRDLRR